MLEKYCLLAPMGVNIISLLGKGLRYPRGRQAPVLGSSLWPLSWEGLAGNVDGGSWFPNLKDVSGTQTTILSHRT